MSARKPLSQRSSQRYIPPMTSLERLLAEHQAELEAVVRRYVEDAADRDELRQEIAVAVWKALPTFRGEASPRTYLLRIARNRAITFCVRRARWRRVWTDLRDDLGVSSDPVAEFDGRELGQRLRAMMATLPSQQRLVLSLTAEGFSPTDIADRCGESAGAVRVALFRARRALRRLMESGE